MRNTKFTAPRAAGILVLIINLFFCLSLIAQPPGDPVPLVVIEDFVFLNASTTAPQTKDLTKNKYYTNTLAPQTPAVISVSAYPNPVVDMLQIETGDTDNELELIELFSAKGQRIKTQQTPAMWQAQLDMRDLRGGIYYLRVTTAAGTTTQTISK